MGWLDFFASVIGSLAWPGVVLIVLWYNRQRLANLPDFIDELTLPGGAKIKFSRALARASAEANLIASEVPDIAHAKDQVKSAPVSELATQFPEAVVVQSFLEIVETLGKMVRFLALPTKGRDPTSVTMELARLGYIDDTSLSLFIDLKDAFTASVRERYVRLTIEECLRYREAAQILNARLRELLPRLEVDNPRKKEWGTS
jgi:hypothetical protein